MDSRPVRFTASAKQDLADIGAYIAQDSPRAAAEFGQHLTDACHSLGEFPGKGRPRGDLAEGLRLLPIGKYLIFYTIRKDAVYIIRLIHGARNIEAIDFE